MPPPRRGQRREAFPSPWSLVPDSRFSATAEPAAPAIAGVLALAEESRVIHDLPLRMLLQHVPDVIVVVRHPAAQPRGLHQPPPGALVRLVVVERDHGGAHQGCDACCSGVSAT